MSETENLSPNQYKLPIPLANWPWQRRLNPHYVEVKAESDAWVQSFNPFEPKEQKKFDLCNLSMFKCELPLSLHLTGFFC